VPSSDRMDVRQLEKASTGATKEAEPGICKKETRCS